MFWFFYQLTKLNPNFSNFDGPKKYEKSSKIFEIFSLAKYHLGLVEKPYGNSQNHSIDAGPRFLSQNVEYVAFIDRAPHL